MHKTLLERCDLVENFDGNDCGASSELVINKERSTQTHMNMQITETGFNACSNAEHLNFIKNQESLYHKEANIEAVLIILFFSLS